MGPFECGSTSSNVSAETESEIAAPPPRAHPPIEPKSPPK